MENNQLLRIRMLAFLTDLVEHPFLDKIYEISKFSNKSYCRLDQIYP